MEVYEAYKTHLKQRFEKATYYQYVSHLKPLFTYLKEQHLSPITLHSFEAQEWVNTLIKQELQPANINAKITASKHFFNFLVEHKYRQQNPFQEVTLVRGLKKEANYIDLKPIEAFLAQQHPNSEDYKVFLYHSIVISIVTMGVHIQDLIALKLKHINLEEKTLCVPKKNEASHTYILSEAFIQLLPKWMHGKQPKDYLLVTERQKPIQENITKKAIQHLEEQLNSTTHLTAKLLLDAFYASKQHINTNLTPQMVKAMDHMQYIYQHCHPRGDFYKN